MYVLFLLGTRTICSERSDCSGGHNRDNPISPMTCNTIINITSALQRRAINIQDGDKLVLIYLKFFLHI